MYVCVCSPPRTPEVHGVTKMENVMETRRDVGTPHLYAMPSRDQLEALGRRELQVLAKELGVRANLKSEQIIDAIMAREAENHVNSVLDLAALRLEEGAFEANAKAAYSRLRSTWEDSVVERLMGEDVDERYRALVELHTKPTLFILEPPHLLQLSELILCDAVKNGVHSYLGQAERDACMAVLAKVDPLDIGPFLQLILGRCSNDNPRVCIAAFEALNLFNSATLSPYVGTFVQSLEHEDSKVRGTAVQMLVKLGNATLSTQVGALIKFLEHEHSGVCQTALEVLIEQDSTTLSTHVGKFVQLLKHEDSGVRMKAMELLGKFNDNMLTQETRDVLSSARQPPSPPPAPAQYPRPRAPGSGRGLDGIRGKDIGEWLGGPPDLTAPGELLLQDPLAAAATDLPPAVVAEIVRDAHGPPLPLNACGALDSVGELRGALGAEQRAALITHLESALTQTDSADAQRDLKLVVTEAELHALIGRVSVDVLAQMGREMLARLGSSTGAAARLQFKLRRRAAIGGTENERIPFHRDNSLVVVNVALNDDFEGARLIFALGNRLVVPVRAAGDATAHDCTLVHAVSRLATGVRYNLYAVFEPTVPAAAAA